MASTVELVFAGDSKSLEKTFANVGSSAKKMSGDLDSAGGHAKAFGSSVDTMNDKVGNSESKFMGTADLLDGLGGAFGLPLEGATGMARSFADLAGGLSSVVGPAIAKFAGMLGIQTAATAAQATATEGAAVAQGGLNAALLANPIGLVVIAIVALVAGFVLAWKHSETFRDVVTGAFEKVRDVVGGVIGGIRGAIEGVFSWAKNNWPLLLGILTGPFGLAIVLIVKNFDTIVSAFKGAWNAVAGFINGIQFKLPKVSTPFGDIGGQTIGIPDLPTFHSGGIVPGPRGAEVPILAMAGERVVPTGAAGGASSGTTVIQLVLDGRVLTEVVHDGLLAKQRRTPLGIAS
jgi:phage-related protein